MVVKLMPFVPGNLVRTNKNLIGYLNKKEVFLPKDSVVLLVTCDVRRRYDIDLCHVLYGDTKVELYGSWETWFEDI